MGRATVALELMVGSGEAESKAQGGACKVVLTLLYQALLAQAKNMTWGFIINMNI